eukprot:CAMPEP_0174847632 /NCGR_PEP_ID=MMETSP1114-20130205/13035_1 /TAXON_ID=312471 /ORGANISM="Neobodo designis, Strain CCAP 1951/1" /LENGTH=231 /DNA_ID=CAMNT_0016081913 /DNA_START=3 /DNA_END=694 /DNA_ORIENTATION=+
MHFDDSDLHGDFHYYAGEDDFGPGAGGGAFTDQEMREAWVRAKMQEAAEQEWFEGRMRGSGGGGERKQRKHQQQQQRRNNNHARRDERPFEDPGPSLMTNAEQEALANMHKDGKSFDFIANALNRPVSDVVTEFNRQSTLGQFESKPRQQGNKKAAGGSEGKQQQKQPPRQQQQQQRGRGPRVDMTAAEFDEFIAADDLDPAMADARIFVDGVEVKIELHEVDDDDVDVDG